jgi:hypothetical protein
LLRDVHETRPELIFGFQPVRSRLGFVRRLEISWDEYAIPPGRLRCGVSLDPQVCQTTASSPQHIEGDAVVEIAAPASQPKQPLLMGYLSAPC